MSWCRFWRYQLEPLLMWPAFQALLAVISTVVRSPLSLQLEVVALRHQLSVYRRSDKRLRIQPEYRLPWACLSRRWSKWRAVLQFVQPSTAIAWHRSVVARIELPGSARLRVSKAQCPFDLFRQHVRRRLAGSSLLRGAGNPACAGTPPWFSCPGRVRLARRWCGFRCNN